MSEGGRRNLLLVAGLALVAALSLAAVAPAASEDRRPAWEGESQLTGNVIAFLSSPPPSTVAPDSAQVDRTRDRITALLDRTGLRKVRALPELGAVAVQPRAWESPEEARRQLLAAPGVTRAVLERSAALRRTPNDPAFNLHDTSAPADDTYQWNLRREHFRGAWNYTRGGHAKIAVLDTGIDGTHPDLGPRIYVSVDKDPGDNSPRVDEDGHGTHVSGLACANGDDNRGILGGAYKCKLVVESIPSLFDSSIAAAIDDAANRGAKVISMSFGTNGGGALPATAAAINRAWNRNVVMVAAACNTCGSAKQGDPAQSLQASGTGSNIHSGKGLVVTAAEYNGTLADFSGNGPGRGSNISMAAYGDSSANPPLPGIFSSYPQGLLAVTFQGEQRYEYLFGTSMATPQVAAAAGLIRSLRPGLSASKVIRLLKRHASRPGGYNGGFNSNIGWGILNAGQAVKAARSA